MLHISCFIAGLEIPQGLFWLLIKRYFDPTFASIPDYFSGFMTPLNQNWSSIFPESPCVPAFPINSIVLFHLAVLWSTVAVAWSTLRDLNCILWMLGVVTRPRAGRPEFRMLARATDISLLHIVYGVCGANPALCWTGTGFSPGGKAAEEWCWAVTCVWYRD